MKKGIKKLKKQKKDLNTQLLKAAAVIAKNENSLYEANYIISTQRNEIKEYHNRDIGINTLTNMYESQLKVQDSEIRRLSIIIDNYETKLNIINKEL